MKQGINSINYLDKKSKNMQLVVDGSQTTDNIFDISTASLKLFL